MHKVYLEQDLFSKPSLQCHIQLFLILTAMKHGCVLLRLGVLIANKIDLDERRVITTAAGKELAQSKGLAYFECSAVSTVCRLLH